ncbi:MAG: hypothetical protein ACO1RT_03000 [Planctomycetaceae bacterium]
MADGLRHHDWGQTSSMMAMLAEVHRDRKKRSRSFKAEEFNPLITNTAKPIPTTVTQLGSILGRRLN